MWRWRFEFHSYCAHNDAGFFLSRRHFHNKNRNLFLRAKETFQWMNAKKTIVRVKGHWIRRGRAWQMRKKMCNKRVLKAKIIQEIFKNSLYSMVAIEYQRILQKIILQVESLSLSLTHIFLFCNILFYNQKKLLQNIFIWSIFFLAFFTLPTKKKALNNIKPQKKSIPWEMKCARKRVPVYGKLRSFFFALKCFLQLVSALGMLYLGRCITW